MERAYNVNFKPHHRTSLFLEKISPCIVYATNKESAKELAQAIVRDMFNGSDYMTKQYSYIIEKED